jgi:DNA polymerase III subunit epsilon
MCGEPMLTGRLAFLDVETTGADPREDRITELGMVLVDDGVTIEEWSTLIDPGREIPYGIQTLTGITNDMVASAPAFAEISFDLAARLAGRVFVAHNARFDYAFLRHEFRRAGMPFEAHVLCTLRLSKGLFPEHRQHNLDALIQRFGLTCSARHRALPDARVLVDLARAWSVQVPQPTLQAACEAVALRPHLPAGLDVPMLEDLPDAPGVYVLYDAQGAALFAGRASNLRTQVLAHWSERGGRARELRAALHAGSLEWFTTAGALGTALHQLRLIESLAPRQNRPPRAHNEAWAVHWDPAADAVSVVDLQAAEAPATDLFGPFRSRGDALAALRGLSREHVLCPQVLGLESGSGACSAHASEQCRGVCAGKESRAAHTLRLAQALARLRLAAWPFPGPVAIVEEDPFSTRRELHVVHDWRYLGSARTAAEAHDLAAGTRTPPAFDVDIFRVLARALAHPGRYRLERLPPHPARQPQL